MRWVIFCRAEPELSRREVRTSAYVVVPLTDVSTALPGQSIVARSRSTQSRPGACLFCVANRHERSHRRRRASPASKEFRRPRIHCLGHFRVTFWSGVTPALHRVTSTLHGRNAKKILVGEFLRESIVCCNSSCNVAQMAAKFPQNPAVSDAVDSSIDCIMPNRNAITDPLHWPTSARACLRHASRRSDAPLLPSASGGTR